MEWAAELYAHAIAVEREAALRYAELAWRMTQQHSEEEARLFAEFAGLQAMHLAARAFFEQAGRVAPDPAARAIAEEMAGEESEHIARLERLMERSPCTGTS